MGEESALVIGAGPAGLATAAMLQRAGVKTAVLSAGEVKKIELGALEWVLTTSGGERRAPAVILATGSGNGFGSLVGHLGVLDRRGEPLVHAARSHPDAPGLYFVLSRRDARAVARRVAYGPWTIRLPGIPRTRPA